MMAVFFGMWTCVFTSLWKWWELEAEGCITKDLLSPMRCVIKHLEPHVQCVAFKRIWYAVGKYVTENSSYEEIDIYMIHPFPSPWDWSRVKSQFSTLQNITAPPYMAIHLLDCSS